MRQAAYIDSSAALKLIKQEAESDQLVDELESYDLFSGDLLETELRRAALRYDLPQVGISDVLEHVSLVAIERESFREAGLISVAHLRSLDALHLTVALRLGLKAIFTYDARMAEAARQLGITVLAPGKV